MPHLLLIALGLLMLSFTVGCGSGTPAPTTESTEDQQAASARELEEIQNAEMQN